jgi:cation:H+ antiporter
MPKAANSPLRNWLLVGISVAVAAPAPLVRLSGAELTSGVGVAISGAAILSAAFLLTWISEAAERDVSRGLALALIALIAVLPEYAVGLYFAWTAPGTPENAHFVTANMTGANRLLVGFAWPTLVLIFWLRTKKSTLGVRGDTSLGLVALGAATLYSFTIPIRGHLSLLDTAVLMSIFAGYIYMVSRSPAAEPELVGPAHTIGTLPAVPRRFIVTLLFLYAAGAIFASAEPFADGLVEIGRARGINEFLLVQWLAPLASEAPEFIIAAILAARGKAMGGMLMLISSKVNQWTLLIGTLPVAYSISGHTFSPLPVDGRQAEEVFLTAAQSAFAVAIFASLSISLLEAGLLFVLFSTQLVLTDQTVRYGFSGAYLLLAAAWFIRDRATLPTVFSEARRSAAGLPPLSQEAMSNSPPETRRHL